MRKRLGEEKKSSKGGKSIIKKIIVEIVIR
jgi:hypothetical protein